jgi:DNA modification methylase
MPQQGARYGTAAARWAGVGPYYAMFPVAFAEKVIIRHTAPGDVVLDPFAGRGTAVFSAAVHGRRGIGMEINPVGWVYSQAKLQPARQESVVERLAEIQRIAHRYRRAARNAPSFFRCCYQENVLQFLIAARRHLDWKNRKVDCTAMAFLLVNLHGKRNDSLSNQMRQTKSMSPAYAIRWWKERNMRPPEVDPLEFLLKRMEWRYAKGIPQLVDSRVYLGDSAEILPQVARYWANRHKRARLLLTSPPYYGVTNYHYDQWLRLWLLGGPPTSRRIGGKHRGKFESKPQYRQLLLEVFGRSKPLLQRDGIVYVRTDRRKLTLNTTREVLREVFPNHQLRCKSRPYVRPTQTRLFGHSEPRLGEIDLILTP